jgi:hypothetical protein
VPVVVVDVLVVLVVLVVLDGEDEGVHPLAMTSADAAANPA